MEGWEGERTSSSFVSYSWKLFIVRHVGLLQTQSIQSRHGDSRSEALHKAGRRLVEVEAWGTAAGAEGTPESQLSAEAQWRARCLRHARHARLRHVEEMRLFYVVLPPPSPAHSLPNFLTNLAYCYILSPAWFLLSHFKYLFPQLVPREIEPS